MYECVSLGLDRSIILKDGLNPGAEHHLLTGIKKLSQLILSIKNVGYVDPTLRNGLLKSFSVHVEKMCDGAGYEKFLSGGDTK